MKMFAIVGVLFAALTSSAFAETNLDLSQYFKRFTYVRDQQTGDLLAIKDNHLASAFSLKPLLKRIKEDLKLIQADMRRNQKGHESLVSELIEEMRASSDAKNTDETLSYLEEVLNSLDQVSVDEAFESKEMKEFLVAYEDRLSRALLEFSINVLGHTKDARYFYKRAVTYQVVIWALDYAKKHFSHIPWLNVASYIVVTAEKMIRERRIYHQNMLLHYFDQVNEADLKLSKKEVDLVVSSIYESRIAWNNIQESNLAAETFETYGFNKFYAEVRTANNRAREIQSMNNIPGIRLSYGFLTGEQTLRDQSKEKIILNLKRNQHSFSMKPSMTFSYNNPLKVAKLRILLRLGQVGLSFVPFNDNIKSMVNDFINSFYGQQVLDEGALVAAFEANGERELARYILLQNINPYEPIVE